MADQQVVQTLCRMCDDRCAINVYLEEGRAVDIDGYKPHPWNRGRLCVKARAAIDMVYHEERLLKPLKKTDSGFQEISLDQAMEEIAEKLLAIKEKYGNRSISAWKGEALGFCQEEDIVRRFLHALGTPNYFSNDSMCYNGRFFGYRLVEGVWPVPDYEYTDCICLWGANPPHAHPNMTQKIMRAKKKGARLIVVDPRLSAVAQSMPLPSSIDLRRVAMMRAMVLCGVSVGGSSVSLCPTSRSTSRSTPVRPRRAPSSAKPIPDQRPSSQSARLGR